MRIRVDHWYLWGDLAITFTDERGHVSLIFVITCEQSSIHHHHPYRIADAPQCDQIEHQTQLTLLDLGGEYYVNDWLSIGASVNNVTDETYVSSCYDISNCWYGPERQVAVSMTADF